MTKGEVRDALSQNKPIPPRRPQTAAPKQNSSNPPPPLTHLHRHPGLDPGSRFSPRPQQKKRDPGSSPG
ncbi:hypothetical protein DTL00_11100 [Sphingomonas melonis]